MVATSPVGNQPSTQRIAALALEVAGDDPGPAHQQLARGLAVPGQLLAVVVDDLHVDAVHRAALLRLQRHALARRPGSQCLAFSVHSGAQRAHLGHAPGVQHLRRRSRPGSVRIIAGGQAEPPMTVRLHGAELQVVGFDVGQQALPDGRHAGRQGHASRLRTVRAATCRPAPGPGTPAWRRPCTPTYGRPQALTWNIGTTGRIASRAEQSSASGSAAA